jgi:hypothetical protein
VSNELPCALRKFLKQRTDSIRVDGARARDRNGAVGKPSSAMRRRKNGPKRRSTKISALRTNEARGVARTAHSGSNGLRTQ